MTFFHATRLMMRAICILERGKTMANSLVEKRSARARISRTSASVTAARGFFSLFWAINFRTFLRYFTLHFQGYRLQITSFITYLHFLASKKGQITHRAFRYGFPVFASCIKGLVLFLPSENPKTLSTSNLSPRPPTVPYMFYFFARVLISELKEGLDSIGSSGSSGDATLLQGHCLGARRA